MWLHVSEDLTRGGRLDILFLVLLALVWAVVLLPSLLRTRLESSPIEGVRKFQNAMGILANARRRHGVSGRWVMVPKDFAAPHRRRRRMVRRRREIFERLLAAAGATLVLGLIPHLHWLWYVHLMVDVAVGAYVVRLLQWKREETPRRRVLRALPADEEIDRSLAQSG